MDAVISKVIAICILLFITIFLGIIPYFIIKRGGDSQPASRREKILSLLNCFAGGVFLGTCLLHLLVEGREDIEDVFRTEYNITGYPVFETLVGAGFFVIACFEQLMLMCIAALTVPSASSVEEKRKNRVKTCQNGVRNEKDPLLGGTKQPQFATEQETERCSSSLSRSTELVRSLSHTHEIENISTASGIRAFLLLTAMSFHTIFDGLAVGLQEKESDVWEVFGAISVHKILVAFCLGLQLFRAFEPDFKKPFVCLLMFSLMSPIGISIGIAVTSSHINVVAQHMTSGILQGFACGTFLYVTCFEILKEELSHKSNVLKVCIAAVGFAAMAAVKTLDKD